MLSLLLSLVHPAAHLNSSGSLGRPLPPPARLLSDILIFLCAQTDIVTFWKEGFALPWGLLGEYCHYFHLIVTRGQVYSFKLYFYEKHKFKPSENRRLRRGKVRDIFTPLASSTDPSLSPCWSRRSLLAGNHVLGKGKRVFHLSWVLMFFQPDVSLHFLHSGVTRA